MDKPEYILVAGGIGVGKTYVVKQNFPGIQIMDLDNEMKRLSLTEYTKENMLTARESLSNRIGDKMANRESLVAMGTAADTAFAINRLLWAKEAGYTTTLVHVTCPLSQAIAQNRHRAAMGRRAVPEEDEYLLARTMTSSELTVGIVRYTDLVDNYKHFDNSR